MHTDVMTTHPRCNLVETAGIDSTRETKVGPHTAGSGVETMAKTATRGPSE